MNTITETADRSVLTDRLIQELLQTPSLNKRIENALIIAQSLLNTQGNVEQALVMLNLAWRLGVNNLGFLNLLVDMNMQVGNINEAVNCCRKASLVFTLQGDLASTYSAVSLGHHILMHNGLPANDDLLFLPLTSLLNSIRFPPGNIKQNPPYRIGYVMWGAQGEYAVLPKVFLDIANKHRRDFFEPVFISINKESDLPFHNPLSAVSKIRADGHQIICNEKPSTNNVDIGINLARTIKENNIDIAVFQCQCPEFFVAASLRPAPVVVGFDHGDPSAYVSRALDVALSAVPKFTIEHVVDSIILPPYFTNSEKPSEQPIERNAINVPEGAKLILTSGLPGKFDKHIDGVRDFFLVMQEILLDHPKVYWCILGVTSSDIQHLLPIMSDETRQRTRLLGIVPSIVPYLKACDLYIDTYPISGGLAVHQAMLEGIPTFTYRFYFEGASNKFKQYSMVGDYLKEDSLHLVEANPIAFKNKIQKMISDDEYCKLHVQEGIEIARSLIDAKRFINVLEDTYIKLIEQKSST